MSEFKQISYRNKVICAGEIYHITQRAPGREILFVEEADYLTILSLMKEWSKGYNVDIFSFCLMPNHYHILLRINKPNLSEAMHSLNTAYSMRFNVKYQRKGHVFSGVYRVSMCFDDIHLIGSSLYIHLNPQKAGLVKDSLDYRWSSVNLYTHPYMEESFVKSDFILKIMSDDLQKASSFYKQMLNESSEIRYENIIENKKAGINFSKVIFKNLLQILSGRKFKKDFIEAEKNLDEMIENFKSEKQKRGPEKEEAKIYLVEQLKSRGYNITEIAKILNLSRRSFYTCTYKVQPYVCNMKQG